MRHTLVCNNSLLARRDNAFGTQVRHLDLSKMEVESTFPVVGEVHALQLGTSEFGMWLGTLSIPDHGCGLQVGGRATT